MESRLVADSAASDTAVEENALTRDPTPIAAPLLK